MDYRIKAISQLQPILKGYRRAAGLTQAALSEKLGITQQSYAQLEANPASASMERLFRVLRVLHVDLVLSDDAPETNELPPLFLAEPATPYNNPATQKPRAAPRKQPKPAARKQGALKKENW
ncbi:helix-turn-helix domain-containing protein [Caballeronia sp. KNU42]